MGRNIPIILLIVVLVALIGGRDVSCACCGRSGIYTVVDTNAETDATSSGETQNQELGSSDSIAPSGITGIFSRLTKKQLITMSLIAAAITLTSSFAVHRAKSSPAKYDIKKEAEKVNSALGTSSGSTQERLDEITKALCTKLSDSTDDPPLDISTLAAISQYAESRTTELRTTEAMTTMKLPTEDPELICAPAAENIFGIVKKVIGKLRDGFIVFDLFNENEKEEVHYQLNETAGANCEPDFFRYGKISDHEGLSFNTTNEFITIAQDNDACKLAVNKILPVLYDMGRDSNSTGVGNATTVNFATNEMKTDFLEGEKISRNKDCGIGFFQITGDDDEKTIQYQNSNTYIADAWPQATNDQKCQERADRVIALLKDGGHSSTARIAGTTASAPTYNLPLLKAAYALGDDCNCGEGALKMVENGENLDFTYHNTNPFIIKAWERGSEGIACIRTGKNVLAQLVEWGLYSKDNDDDIIIPERNDNIEIITQKVSAAKECNCKKGFFKLIVENGYYKVKYEKNNPFIKLEVEKITDEQLCQGVAYGVYNILKAYNVNITPGRNVIPLMAKQAVQDELTRKLDIVATNGCGDDFFTADDKISYVGVTFNANNHYINPFLSA